MAQVLPGPRRRDALALALGMALGSGLTLAMWGLNVDASTLATVVALLLLAMAGLAWRRGHGVDGLKALLPSGQARPPAPDLGVLASMAREAPGLFLAWDREGRLLACNDQAARRFRLPREELLGRLPKELANHGLVESFCPAVDEEAGSPLLTRREVILPLEDGETVWDLTRFPLHAPDGAVLGEACLGMDVTARKAAESDMRREQAAAQAMDAAKDSFLAMMSHEIRTPLNGMLGMLQLLETTRLDQEQRQYLLTAASSGRGLLHLVNDILDYSRIASGRFVLTEEPFSPREVVLGVRHLLEPRAAIKGVALRVELDPSLPDVLRGDGGRLRQIILNLATNAMKFTNQGEVAVRLGVDAGGGRERVLLRGEVVDTGVGIPPERLQDIFEPFVQVDGPMQRAQRGTGLGLGIVKRLCDAMGGVVTVESEPGKGSRFRFLAPFLPGGAMEDGSGEAADDAACLELDGARHINVLLVEDDQTNREFTSILLSRKGMRVRSVCTGMDALEAASREMFDVILMDVQLPEMDGLEATRRIRTEEQERGRRRSRIIAVTAHAMKGDRERCLEAGMDEYLSKPVDAMRLVSEVERVRCQ